MKIIFLSRIIGNGGAEREIANFANELVKLKNEVYVFCTENTYNDYELDPKVSLHQLLFRSRINIPVIRVLFRYRNAYCHLRHMDADFIIPFCVRRWLYPFFWSITLFSKTKFLYVVQNNMNKFSFSNEHKQRRIGKLMAYLADGIWIQIDEQRLFFSSHLQKKIFVIPNSIDQKFLSIPLRDRRRIKNFVSVGRIHPQKNHKMLVEAFWKMIQKTNNHEATLTIYGRSGKSYWETEKELRELIQRLNLEDRVFLPGWAVDIEKIYSNADAFVLSSNYEGLPNALMEAMAAGLPCISTDCETGPSALIKSGINGLLVPVGDVQTLTDAMIYYIDYPMEANRMGVAAKSQMQAWDTPEQLALRLLSNLQRIIDQR